MFYISLYREKHGKVFVLESMCCSEHAVRLYKSNCRYNRLYYQPQVMFCNSGVSGRTAALHSQTMVSSVYSPTSVCLATSPTLLKWIHC